MAFLLLHVAAMVMARTATAETDFRLSRAVLPTHYRLDLQPHFQDDNFSVYGQVWIDVQVKEESSQVTLHSSKLQILKATVIPLTNNETLESLAFAGDGLHDYSSHADQGNSVLQDAERGTVTMPALLRAGGRYRLYFRYKGRLSDTFTGFYKVSYNDSHNETRWLASTTFEPNEAHRAFPCFDEPEFKARYQVNLANRQDMVALSNMPRRSVQNMTGVQGWVWNRFDETPPMSTYLVAFFVGFLDSRETQTANGTPFRVWARPEVMAQTQYALEIGPRIIDFFSSLLEVPEPLPKHDVIALPHFIAGALENWGLISFGERNLLHEAGVSPESRRQQVAHILAHELAHSWFGNMVTARWWKEIWLSEGFATYLSALGANHVDPTWDTLSVTSVTALLRVFSVDSLQSSHSLTFPIDHQTELRQIFDDVTYYKGYCLLRMLNHTLGQETFLRGCGRYVRRHKFGSVDQLDLWEELNAQAHEDGSLAPGLDLGRLMAGWTSRPGFPVIAVTRNYSAGNAIVTQARFQRPLAVEEARGGQTDVWWVPITYTSQPELGFSSTHSRLWVDPEHKQTNLTDMPGPEHWVIFNVQAAGMYRVNYDLKNWQLISDFMRSDRYEDVPVLNRALLLDDALNLAGIGMLPYHVALEVTSYLRRESHYLPWKAALGNLDHIGRMFRLTDALASYKRFVLYLIEPQLRNLNIDSHQNDSYLKTSHQKEIVRWACLTGHPACLHNATTLFKTWMVGNFNPVPQSLSTVLYCTAIEQGGLEQWKFLWTQYKTSAIAVSEKKGALKALGCSQNTDILEQYLRWSVQIGSGLKPGDSVAVFKAVASTDTGFNVAKEFLINNPDSIEKAVGPSRLVDMLKVIGTRMNQAAHLKQLEEFLSQNTQKLEPLRRTVSKVTERVRYNIQWMESNYKEIHSWLQEREKNFHYRSNADRG